ncbi:DUF4365 domain-containing protein [Saccharopolyspora sp. NFXS83]|uniref:DUF4365 domain-containing protein n=1 Tax=Saccharopolyspora sp. NFXS83 TaxID=2993560 RepID=UPI00224A9CF5|nr:DUF4365 domain-containing protein [Saccharopolyspora sp. NFXS83]MCX2729443.1 DUF4365 domain-containing protein [Saccharopolyspora sp. NFXS83]
MTQTKHAVETGMRWVFREQPKEDYGIDAQIEVVDGEEVLGRLVALQIKTGRSYFSSPAEDGWWFSEKAAHFLYWLDFSIPVVVVLVDLDSGLCYWQLVTESTVERSSGRRWKLRVPKAQILGRSAVRPLHDATDEAAERGVRLARQPLGSAVSNFSAADLEVHSASQEGDALPEYVIRAHDFALGELVADAVGSRARSGCAVLLGGSGTGKTRALYEALHWRGPDAARTSLAEAGWRVWPEVNPLPPKQFLEQLGRVGPRTIVWLNEAQRYLRDPSADVRAEIATALLELVGDVSRKPVLVLGTLWPEHWQELTRTPNKDEVDQFGPARRLLSGRYLRVPDTFTNAEVTRARQSGDRLLAIAANRVTDSAVTQQLAGAPDLLQRYETAGTASQAVIHAVVDARRFGHGEWFSTSFLPAAARSYLSGDDRRRVDEDPSWFEAAIADLVVPGNVSGPVLHRALLGYRLDDFLEQEGRERRRFEFPSEEFWAAVSRSELSSSNRIRMADAAAARMRLRIAASVYAAEETGVAGERLCELAKACAFRGAWHASERLAHRAADAGAPEALTSLAKYRWSRDPHAGGSSGDLELLRRAADLGDVEAFNSLAFQLEKSGDKEAAEAAARRALELGSWEATVSVAGWREIDFPDEGRRLIYGLPEEMRWAALAQFACDLEGVHDFDGAERFAVTAAVNGRFEAILMIAEGRCEIGKKGSARRLIESAPRPDLPEEKLRMAVIHARTGAQDEARELLVDLSGRHDLDDQVEAIIKTWPHLAAALVDVLVALQEHHAACRLRDGPSFAGPPRSVPSDGDDDLPLDLSKADGEVADAYATLAEFHARRGELEQAESMGMVASTLGNRDGLVALSWELLQRGDHANAERLLLCVVNMDELLSWTFPERSPLRLLAEARGDESLLDWGLEADGSSAEPW